MVNLSNIVKYLDEPAWLPDGFGNLSGVGGINKLVQDGLGIMLGVSGLISLVYIVIGGIKYTQSSGDSGKADKAKNTIVYALIGLIVSILGYSIVSLIMTRFQGEWKDFDDLFKSVTG